MVSDNSVHRPNDTGTWLGTITKQGHRQLFLVKIHRGSRSWEYLCQHRSSMTMRVATPREESCVLISSSFMHIRILNKIHIHAFIENSLNSLERGKNTVGKNTARRVERSKDTSLIHIGGKKSNHEKAHDSWLTLSRNLSSTTI